MTISRFLRVTLLCFVLIIACIATEAQSSTATLSGTVEDQNGAAIPAAAITVENVGTRIKREVTTNENGAFTVPLLPPGEYTLIIRRDGFASVQVPAVILNVGDQKSLQVSMKVGDINSAVEVRPDASLIRTDGSVGTVVDRQFVENIPLNGRSFQSLLALTPGVTLAVTSGNNANEGGQFSVNGQRTNANYITIDGVSANTGISSGNGTFPGQSGSGTSVAYTAQGSTSSLVSVDALQEFRIQTSTYAPEFGRMPGGQISLITRSGSRSFHGTAFEYFRNDALDAADWFVSANRLTKPPLRQNQFGGTFSGPIYFPGFGESDRVFWSGKESTFFFLSYEGLRLRQPQSSVVRVPSLITRQTAHPDVRPLLDAFPLPNRPNIGGGLAEFAGSWSDRSEFDALSLRVDHKITQNLNSFGRYSRTPSLTNVRTGTLSYTSTSNQLNSYLTAGIVWVPSEKIANDLRFNITNTVAPVTNTVDTFGGAIAPPISIFAPGSNPQNASFQAQVTGGGSFIWGVGTSNEQRQLNIVNMLTYSLFSHNFKFGIDFRRINPVLGGPQQGVGSERLVFNVNNLPTARATLYQRLVFDPNKREAIFDNLSIFAQDTWQLSKSLTITYGLRWEFVPPARSAQGDNPLVLKNLDDPYGGRVSFAPRNTPLWRSRYNNFAPRIGVSYLLSPKQGQELVIRGGFGVFHDLGYGQIATSFQTWPFSAFRACPNSSNPACPAVVTFPLSPQMQTPPSFLDRPSQVWTIDSNLELPLVYQWNLAAEKSFGAHQTLSVSLVGANGRKILKLDRYEINLVEYPSPLFPPIPINVNRNLGHSDYRALQIQFQRKLHRNIQTMLSYTFGRSRDTSSSDISVTIPSQRVDPEVDYGYSEYDVRHLLAAAVTLQMPTSKSKSFWNLLRRDWSIDAIITARSGKPIDPTATVTFNVPGLPTEFQSVRVDRVEGQPFWINDSTAPGGRRLNRSAFAIPGLNTQGNLSRGIVRGFGAHQINTSLHRDFPIFENVRLQLRFEAFNILNTPNFSDPSGSIFEGQSPATFGAATQMLNKGIGGLNSLYQNGGARSIQLAVKISF